jgi:hypothetical protein
MALPDRPFKPILRDAAKLPGFDRNVIVVTYRQRGHFRVNRD